ncbi:hypothetical protein ABEB36_014740 [Hypothenemus hampei]|uniref:Tc1-like transposase DDE domain-containing protein n=1 Tax=Hypothenemus hampei TaxID=57062 RepID=A0ABD1E3K3_HYPHA
MLGCTRLGGSTAVPPERAALASGVSIAAIRRIARQIKDIEEDASTSFSTPNMKRQKQSSKSNLDDGGETGFVKNAYLKFKSGNKSGDYHDEMNYSNYKNWLQEKLNPNRVLVIDNAPYHNV